MSHVDAALRRAAADAAGDRPTTQETAHSTTGWLRPDSQTHSPEFDAHLPPPVAAQLANLVQALECHPLRPRTIAFASAARGLGTSTCVASLGRYLASRRAKVLMIDANFHSPTLHALAGVDQENGLSDVIAGGADVAETIKPTPVPGLFVVTSGGWPQADRLLPAAALRQHVLCRTSEYDYVLLDCPAVNAHEDAGLTAATCDGVILVIEAARTSREAAQASKALLARAQCTILGVFMNRRQFYVPKFLYDRL